ncbi:MAG TPA: nucleoside 2-deoxyribosyltransferase, partial [Micromonosporaceae bacterium]|nr:nucleoside 2-deoxyribosyltransferase [Micromonosporaceae bacterium]
TTDFAVVVLGADDVTTSRGVEQLAPRDNLLIEFGGFAFGIGRERAIALVDRAGIKWPSDLLGLKTLHYSRRKGAVEIAAAARSLVRLIQALGRRQRPVRPRLYWCAPHSNLKSNNEAAFMLRQHGIDVTMPTEFIDPRLNGRREAARKIRDACKEAIEGADLIAVDVDAYGLDSAWEIGYADALGRRVVGLTRNGRAYDEERTVRLRSYKDNFMHGWDERTVMESIDDLFPVCRNKVVHVCGPFRNKAAMDELRNSGLHDVADEVVFPKDSLDVGSELPRDYRWRIRVEAVALMDRSDVIVTMLPRYGMDTSWQLGYAAGRGQPIYGWIAPGEVPEFAKKRVVDHWMHGWLRQKLIVTSLDELAAMVRGEALVNQRGLPDAVGF